MSVLGISSPRIGVAFAVTLGSLFGATARGNDVRIVDVSGATAGSYSDLQVAVDSSSAGDILLVKAGIYPPFVAGNKSITIVADPPHSVSVASTLPFISDELGEFSDTSRIQGLAVGGVVIVRGITFRGLEILNCAGTVLLEDCRCEITAPTARIAESGKVILHRSTFDGPDGFATADLSAFKLGGGGLEIRNTKVSMTDCFVFGGDGQDYVLSFLGPFPNEAGFPGMIVDTNSLVLMTRTKVIGGSGGDAGSDGAVCTNGSAGAPAVDLRSGVVHRKASQTTGGNGGAGLVGVPCAGLGQPGAAAPPIQQAIGTTVKNMPGPAGSLALLSPVREGQKIAINVIGPSKGTFLILFASAPTLVPLPSLGGATLLTPPIANGIVAGSFNAQGSYIGSILLRDLDPGVDGVVVVGQNIVCDRNGLCSPAAVSVMIGVSDSF